MLKHTLRLRKSALFNIPREFVQPKTFSSAQAPGPNFTLVILDRFSYYVVSQVRNNRRSTRDEDRVEE